MQPYYRLDNNTNKRLLFFKNYIVREVNSKRFQIERNNGKVISHKENWKAATKLAKLLQEAYDEGYANGGY